MRTLKAYNFLTLNGFFRGTQQDISWHTHGGDEEQYSVESLERGGILLFGRRTYDLMASFWPTPAARGQFPEVAAGMNRAEKIVFSKKPFIPRWENTRVITGDIVDAVRALKATPGENMTILGSGSIVSLFTEHRLIDEYEFLIDPVAIPDGTPVFAGITKKLELELTGSKVLQSGAVLVSYRPRKAGIVLSEGNS
jgi:dihydrofolate reductase